MNKLFLILTIFSVVFATEASFAIEARDLVYPPPKMVQRTFRVTLAECLANLPTESISVLYGCHVTAPAPTPGDQIAYRTTSIYDFPITNSATQVLTTPSGTRFGAAVKTYVGPDGFHLLLESMSKDASTGRAHVIKRTDAVSEISRIWTENRFDARSWQVMVWVFGR